LVRQATNPATIRTKFDEEPDGLIFQSEPKSLLRVEEERARRNEFIGADGTKIGVETSSLKSGGALFIFSRAVKRQRRMKKEKEA